MRILAILSFAFILAAVAGPATAMPSNMPALPPQPKVHPAGIPKNALLVSPCIATMGEHWYGPKRTLESTKGHVVLWENWGYN